jgi:hypothetical protein
MAKLLLALLIVYVLGCFTGGYLAMHIFFTQVAGVEDLQSSALGKFVVLAPLACMSCVAIIGTAALRMLATGYIPRNWE